MLTTDIKALLAAIRLHPDEDTPRLMLADCVAESGHPEAGEFIREDVRYDREGKRKSATIPRSRAKLARTYGDWLALLWGEPNLYVGSVGWDNLHIRRSESRIAQFVVVRGLPDRVLLTCPMLMERAEQFFLFPLTKVTVTDRRPWSDASVEALIELEPLSYGWTAMPYPSTWSTWEESTDEIPTPLYLHLSPSTAKSNRGHYWSHSEAMRDLNAAALAFGRASVANPS